jgi:hypothetical protein
MYFRNHVPENNELPCAAAQNAFPITLGIMTFHLDPTTVLTCCVPRRVPHILCTIILVLKKTATIGRKIRLREVNNLFKITQAGGTYASETSEPRSFPRAHWNAAFSWLSSANPDNSILGAEYHPAYASECCLSQGSLLTGLSLLTFHSSCYLLLDLPEATCLSGFSRSSLLQLFPILIFS